MEGYHDIETHKTNYNREFDLLMRTITHEIDLANIMKIDQKNKEHLTMFCGR